MGQKVHTADYNSNNLSKIESKKSHDLSMDKMEKKDDSKKSIIPRPYKDISNNY